MNAVLQFNKFPLHPPPQKLKRTYRNMKGMSPPKLRNVAETPSNSGSLPIFRVCLVLIGFAVVHRRLMDTPIRVASKGFSTSTIAQTSKDGAEDNANPAIRYEKSAPLSPLHPNKECPTFAGQGGQVFIFFHLAKAGGTTIRRLFQGRLPNTEVLARVRPDTADPKVRQYLSGHPLKEGRTLLVELHDSASPSLHKMEGYLKDWRKFAALHNNPKLFIFTIVREPISYALSFFTYMNVRQGNIPRNLHWQDGSRANLTESDLVKFQLPSPQCLFFSRGEAATTNDFPIYGSKFDPHQECPEVYNVMTHYMDWIGTLERMQEETLPLLTYLTSHNAEIGRSFEKQNAQQATATKTSVAPTLGGKDKLAKETLAFVQEKVAADQDIYGRVQKDYPFDFWSRCMEKSQQK